MATLLPRNTSRRPAGDKRRQAPQGVTLIRSCQSLEEHWVDLALYGELEADPSGSLYRFPTKVGVIGDSPKVDDTLFRRVGTELMELLLNDQRYSPSVRHHWNSLISSHKLLEVESSDCVYMMRSYIGKAYMICESAGRRFDLLTSCKNVKVKDNPADEFWFLSDVRLLPNETYFNLDFDAVDAILNIAWDIKAWDSQRRTYRKFLPKKNLVRAHS